MLSIPSLFSLSEYIWQPSIQLIGTEWPGDNLVQTGNQTSKSLQMNWCLCTTFRSLTFTHNKMEDKDESVVWISTQMHAQRLYMVYLATGSPIPASLAVYCGDVCYKLHTSSLTWSSTVFNHVLIDIWVKWREEIKVLCIRVQCWWQEVRDQIVQVRYNPTYYPSK